MLPAAVQRHWVVVPRSWAQVVSLAHAVSAAVQLVATHCWQAADVALQLPPELVDVLVEVLELVDVLVELLEVLPELLELLVVAGWPLDELVVVWPPPAPVELDPELQAKSAIPPNATKTSLTWFMCNFPQKGCVPSA
jgi:hypothetical protein